MTQTVGCARTEPRKLFSRSSRGWLATGIAVIATLTFTAADAVAQDTQDPPDLTWSYLTDGGMVPYIYGAGAALLSFFAFEPRDPPLWFSADEGGQPANGDTFPNHSVAATGIAAWLTVGLVPAPARWYHVKGFAQSWLMTGLLTRGPQVLFGRHRPDYNLDGDIADQRASFPSGHSSQNTAHVVYLGLYLRRHVFNRWRGSSALPWWELLSYSALAGLNVWDSYTRVVDNRHHLSDVLVGTALGATMATTFFLWQDRRYQRARTPLMAQPGERRVLILPNPATNGLTLVAAW